MNKAKPTWEEWKAEFVRLCKEGGWTDEEIDRAWPWDTIKDLYYDGDTSDYFPPDEALYEELSSGL